MVLEKKNRWFDTWCEKYGLERAIELNTNWLNSVKSGKQYTSEETRQKMRNAAKLKPPVSKEARKKMSLSHKGKKMNFSEGSKYCLENNLRYKVITLKNLPISKFKELFEFGDLKFIEKNEIRFKNLIRI